MDSQKRLKIEKLNPFKKIKFALIYFLGGIPDETHKRFCEASLRVSSKAFIKIRILKRRNATLEEQNKLLKQKLEAFEEGQDVKNAENRD